MSKSSAKSSFNKNTTPTIHTYHVAKPAAAAKRQKSVEFMDPQAVIGPNPTTTTSKQPLPQNPSNNPRHGPCQRPTIRALSLGLRRSISSDDRVEFQDAIHAGKADYRRIFGTR